MEEKTKVFCVYRPAFSRDNVLLDAVKKCLDVMYKASYPPISYEDLCEESRKINEGLEKPKFGVYDLHYLPNRIYEEILKDFIEAYEMKSNLPDIVEILKNYFKDPVVDKYIKPKDGSPGYKGYDHLEPMPQEHYEVAAKFLDMANSFFKWNKDEDAFYFTVCNVSPSGNREVVEKWYHEHGNPDFKIPEDSYWFDPWASENSEIDYNSLEFVNDEDEVEEKTPYLF